MARPFDTATKFLIENRPGDCLAFLGLKADGEVDVIDADLATVTREADKIIRVRSKAPWMVHVELQSSADSTLPDATMRYNVLIIGHHGLPVRSVIVLLRPEADCKEMTGNLAKMLPGETKPYLEFRYQVVRCWEKPVEEVLEGGIGMLPLAPLCKVGREDLPAVIRRMDERLRREAPTEAATLMTSAGILMGLVYERAFVESLLQGVRNMKESSFYQAILDEGRAEGEAKGKAEGKAEEARRLLLRLGTRYLGNPDPDAVSAIDAIQEVARLEELLDRVLEADSWANLLGRDNGKRGRGRKKQ